MNEFKDKSLWNISLPYLEELNKRLFECNQANFQSNYSDWLKLLDIIYINIECVMDESEKKEQKKFISMLNKEIDGNNIATLSNLGANRLRSILGLYEIFLRKVCYDHDLILTRKDDVTKAMGRGVF